MKYLMNEQRSYAIEEAKPREIHLQMKKAASGTFEKVREEGVCGQNQKFNINYKDQPPGEVKMVKTMKRETAINPHISTFDVPQPSGKTSKRRTRLL